MIKPEATPADVAFIESHRTDIPILEMLMVQRRRYLPGGFMAHASGYVGEVSEQQIEASNGKLRPGDIAGKSGLERQYNDLLVGTDGMRRVIVNSVGKEMGHLDQQEAIPGKQIQLTIDYDLQQVAEKELAGQEGRGGCARSANRRSAGVCEPSGARPERFRGTNFERRMAKIERGSRQAAVEPRNAGATGAGIGIQDHHGHGDAGIEDAAGKLHSVLPGIWRFLWADAQVLGVWKKQPWRGESA